MLRGTKRGSRRSVLLKTVAQVIINKMVGNGVRLPMEIQPVGLIADGGSDRCHPPVRTMPKVAIMADDIPIKEIMVAPAAKNSLIRVVVHPIPPDDGVVHAVKLDTVMPIFDLESLKQNVPDRYILP